MSTLRGGLTFLAIGPPGTGKSWLLGSIGAIAGPVKLLAAKPREINSYNYMTYGISENAEVFRDKRWAPPASSFEAGAFTLLYQRVLDLYEDGEYAAVILDPFTDVVTLAAHELLAAERVDTPRKLRDSIGFYGELKYKLKDFTQALCGLASPGVPKPKHVLVAVHAQPTADEDIKGKTTKESRARGIEFMGDVLPAIEGSYRRDIAGEFDVVGYTSVTHKAERNPKTQKMERQTKYVVQLNADSERHAKIALVPRLEEGIVPNDMAAVFAALGLET